ncbi:MAG: hypothetical protein ACTHPS_07375 [Streptosporangiaceae bacterium]
MSRWKRAGPALGFALVSLAVIGIAPAVLLGGELVNRHYLYGMRARPDLGRIETRLARMPRGREFLRRWLWAAARRRYFRYTGPGWVSPWEACEGRRFGALAAPFLANPVWIALTAPARWLIGLARPLAGRRRRGNGNGPPLAGVREPRRPRPDQPAGAMALPEPRWPFQ